ncbi:MULTISPECIES: hypothetical protein [unclassified Variovorax]|uniref:hypothetical protein n=1 Tax=unclassified Variovorax TaxID=663243 RepID=UPI00076C2DE8|nr:MULTISPECIES: hypothetical protein [unclassified Variovorax]KWT97712.1 hypothetical protein APY03_1264 [Variovorax sp. WDL1]PNG48812.1 hypothetical protein CHC06_06553 [Variovorax sp. B2]PNG49319.1 hypothetical protein CHC07_06201 [Variovorax sp. B4]VTV18398.1 hypothetical protein WDL1P2_00123 [Variovorax sp. WDL1]
MTIRSTSASQDQFLEMLAQNGYTHVRRIGEKYLGLLRFNFTIGLVVGLDWAGHERRYCYELAEDAIAALDAWDGQGHPGGPWIKCKGAGIDLLNPSFGLDVASLRPAAAVPRNRR